MSLENRKEAKRYAQIYDQLAKLGSPRMRNDPFMVGIIGGYAIVIPGLFYVMITKDLIGLTFAVMGYIIMMSTFYNYVRNKRDEATEGHSYIDNTLRLPDAEVIEQIAVNQPLRNLVKPKNPFPYHKAKTQDEEIDAVLRPIGVKYYLGDADYIRKDHEERFDAAVEEKLNEYKEIAKKKAEERKQKEKDSKTEKKRGRGRPPGSKNKKKKKGVEKDE